MAAFSFNENALSRLICNANYRLEVSDGNQLYQVPLNFYIPKSSKYFVAKKIDSQQDIVLDYRSIKQILVDYRLVYSF
ncbi:MAG: hypothetical protein AB7S54_11600 [Bacteroidales bacterium]